jgi:phosphatidylglycerophosphate synthase
METYRDALNKLMIPVGHALAVLGIHPHLLSMSGILFGSLSAYFFLTHKLVLAIFFFAISGLSDSVDGIVARENGITSQFGGFMDNFCSLYTDSAALVGLMAAGLCNPWWGFAALVGTMARLLTFRLEGLVAKDEAQALRSRFPYALAGKGDRILMVAVGAALGRIPEAMVFMAISTNLVAILRSYHLYSWEKANA